MLNRIEAVIVSAVTTAGASLAVMWDNLHEIGLLVSMFVTLTALYLNWRSVRGNTKEQILRYRMLKREEQEQIEAIKRRRLWVTQPVNHSSVGPFCPDKPSGNT